MEETRTQEDTEETEKILDVPKEEDIIEKTIGALGRWQIAVSILACLEKLPASWFNLSIIFIAPPTTFTCQNNETNQCNCSSYSYNRTVFNETIITEWDLVCDKAYLANVVQTVSMSGVLVGNLIFGYCSDRFGRRNTLIAAVILQVVTGISAYFAKWFTLFVILRFLIAVALGGTVVVTFVLIIEIVGTKWRTLFTIVYQIPFTFGFFVLPIFSYFLREWRHFHLAICSPSVLFLSYYWILPESPRWLLTVGRKDKALKVLKRAAHHNRLATETIAENLNLYMEKTKTRTEQSKGNMVDLVRTPIIRTYTICLSYNWFVCGFCFFASAQYIGQLEGNIFINVAFTASTQIAGVLFAMWSLNAWGRRNTLTFSNVVASISCLLIGLVPPDSLWIRTVLSSIDMFALGALWPTMFIYSGELFPTVIRNIGVGTCSTLARVGSMGAPFIVGLVSVKTWLPTVVLGVVPLIGALLSRKLPETLDCKLPNTVEEAEGLVGRKRERNLNRVV